MSRVLIGSATSAVVARHTPPSATLAVRIAPRLAPTRAAHVSNINSGTDMDALPLLRMSRRTLFITIPAAPVLLHALKAKADDEAAYKMFTGYNMQPDLYLGYGTSMNHIPMYTFEYPVSWEEDSVTKTEKSTMGMDGRVIHPKRAKEKAFVIALGGKDYADARMVSLKQTMDAFAGGDADLRECLSDAYDLQEDARKVDGRDVFYYDIKSDKRRYLSTISLKDGTMYALFVTAPVSSFAKDEEQLKHIQNTFKLM